MPGLADGPDRQLPADLRDGRAVRPRDGLRDVPRLGDARGLRPLRRAAGRRLTGLPGLGPRRHGRRADHGQRLRRLHPRRHDHDPADRVRPRRRCLRRRLPRTDDPGPAVLVLLDRRAWWLPRLGWTGGSRSSTWRAPRCTARSSTSSGSEPTARRPCWPGTLCVHEGGLPVQLAATAGRVNRLTLPEAADRPRPGGTCWSGAQRPFSGEVVVDRPAAAGAARGRQPEGDTHRARRARRPVRPGRRPGPGSGPRRGPHAAGSPCLRGGRPSRRSTSSPRLSSPSRPSNRQVTQVTTSRP